MAVLDNLEVLITADASNMENVLKSTLSTVLGTVNKINAQEVDWTSIFTAAVSPAIISGVATMFAFAISNAVNFNAAATNLNNINTTGVDNLNNSLTSTSTLAQSSGLSLGDASSAFNAFAKAGLDTAAATLATSDAAGIARDTGESLATVVDELTTLFNNWGITTSSGVTNALTGLVNASQNGTFSFDTLAKNIADAGPFLKAKTNISDTATNLAALSTQSGLSQNDILSAFQAIAQGSVSNFTPMSVLIGNVSQAISSGPTGLVTAFGMIEKKVQEMGPSVSQTVLTSTGLSSQAISDFSSSSVTNFDNAATAAAGLNNTLVPLQDDLAAHEPEMAKLAADWNRFKDALSSFVVPPALQLADKILTSINDAMANPSSKLNQFGTSVANASESAVGTPGGLLAEYLTGSDHSGGINIQSLLGSGQHFSNPNAYGVSHLTADSSAINDLIGALKNGIAANTANSGGGTQTINTINQAYALNIKAGQAYSAQDIAQKLYALYNAQ